MTTEWHISSSSGTNQLIPKSYYTTKHAVDSMTTERHISSSSGTNQLTRLVLVDWFVFHFCLIRFPFFFGCLHFFFRSSSIFFVVAILVFQKNCLGHLNLFFI